MNILVIGSGGREHALVWKLRQSPNVDKLYCIPGNAGTAQITQKLNAESQKIAITDIPALANFAASNEVDITVVGHEVPLCAGISDYFHTQGLKVFGPNKRAAQLEGSKIFAKQFMKKYNIPTPYFEICNTPSQARKIAEYFCKQYGGVVVKADGLAYGKGVIIAHNYPNADKAIKQIMEEKEFGEAGNKVVLEEIIEGEEVSVLSFSDGKTILPLVAVQDHKRAYDNDTGPNTGGMGAYAPVPIMTKEIKDQVVKTIISKTQEGLLEEGVLYQGVLYFGLMLTKQGPKVLEYNARFGDPETQALLPLLKNDIVEVIDASLEQRLGNSNLEWENKASCCVVLASGGYPGQYEKEKNITGPCTTSSEDVIVFHAGTKKTAEGVATSGGRVLGVTGLGSDLKEAISNAYSAVDKIYFPDMHYRRDIGRRALK